MTGNAQIAPFATLPDGTSVERIRIAGGGLMAQVLTYGATIQDLRLEGVDHPLVLGADTMAPYLGPMTYFGAIVGRYANRIANGQFEVGGHKYQVPLNGIGKHALHGGSVGTGQLVWNVAGVASDHVDLTLCLADGDMGFPGELNVTAQISLRENGALCFDILARTSKATPCSFAHHGYFNLNGIGDITGHLLEIDAASYLPVDDDLIPTGEIRHVVGTKFDFRTARPIGKTGLDHNFCLSEYQQTLRKVARLRSPTNGLELTVKTTEPGLQVYDGAHISAEGLVGLEGRIYGPCSGCALETQAWPDAPNRPDFPNAILDPGNTYRHQTTYQFRWQAAECS